MFSNQIHPEVENPIIESARCWLRRNWAKWLSDGETWEAIKEQLLWEYALSDEQVNMVMEEIQKEVQ